jgi:nitroreductase
MTRYRDRDHHIQEAAVQAPSGKNRQPWRFVVVRSEKRNEMLSLLRAGIAAAEERGERPGSSEWTAKVMEQAPVIVFVFNPDGLSPWTKHTEDQMVWDVIDIQSIGASIQNMLLAAREERLGSLWICDIFYAYEELSAWMGETGALTAAALGYPAESPAARPRKPIEEVVRFL